MNRIQTSILLLGSTFTLVGLALPSPSQAQVIQLPTFRFFNARSVVSVPDGGAIQLGGVNRSSRGSISRGVPGLTSIPGVGRLAGNRGVGGEASSGRVTVRPRLIIMSELEAEVMAKAAKLQRQAAAKDPNGSTTVQSKADFITRDIGRSAKR